MNKRQLALATAEPGAQYGPGSASYSPQQMTPEATTAIGLPAIATQADDPNLTTSDAPVIRIPRPPAPDVGGEPGISRGLGWSTGILPSRARRMKFQGETLVVPTMGVHPAVGPVGFSNRQQRLDNGVAGLINQWLPSQQEINEQFTTGAVAQRNRNPLD